MKCPLAVAALLLATCGGDDPKGALLAEPATHGGARSSGETPEPDPKGVPRSRMLPVAASDGGEELGHGYSRLLEAGIRGHLFGSKGWFLVVPEADVAKARDILGMDEASKPHLMSSDEVVRYVKRYGYGDAPEARK